MSSYYFSSLKGFFLVVGIFWVVLFLLGYPPPCIDDLYFSGAALNLVQTGHFSNPFLLEWSHWSKDYFFFQPPFHSYILAFWLKIFGVSTASLLAFICACGALFSVFSSLILEKYRFPRFLAYGAVFFFAAWMSNRGFRQDALGFSLLVVGLYFISQDRPWTYFLGFFFQGVAVCTAPLALAYGVALSAALLSINYNVWYNLWLQSKEKQDHFLNYLRPRLLALLLAMGLVLGLFLWAIHFQWSTFIEIFSWHASTRRAPTLGLFSSYLSLLRHGQDLYIYGPAHFLFGILVLYSLFKWKSLCPRLKITLSALCLGISIHFLIYLDVLYGALFFFIWLGIAFLLTDLPIHFKTRRVLIGVSVFFFLLNQSLSLVAFLGQEKTPLTYANAIKKNLQKYKDQTIVVDERAARLIFDYKFPVGYRFQNWNFLGPAPMHWPTSLSRKTTQSVWMIAAAKSLVCGGLPEVPLVQLLGRRFNSIPLRPNELLIVE